VRRCTFRSCTCLVPIDTPPPAQVDVEIKYEDLDDIDDDESGSDVDAVRALRRCACNDLGDTAPRSTGCSLPARRVAAP
jgi:hypothetical protein